MRSIPLFSVEKNNIFKLFTQETSSVLYIFKGYGLFFYINHNGDYKKGGG